MPNSATPGPWTVHMNHPADMPVRVIRAGEKVVATVPGFGISTAELDGNATLLAAAPALLASLKSILDGGIADPVEVAKAHTIINWVEA